MQPVTTRRAPSLRWSSRARIVSIDSLRASSMNAHVLITTRSAEAASSVAVMPSASRVPMILSLSTWFLGAPQGLDVEALPHDPRGYRRPRFRRPSAGTVAATTPATYRREALPHGPRLPRDAAGAGHRCPAPASSDRLSARHRVRSFNRSVARHHDGERRLGVDTGEVVGLHVDRVRVAAAGSSPRTSTSTGLLPSAVAWAVTT